MVNTETSEPPCHGGTHHTFTCLARDRCFTCLPAFPLYPARTFSTLVLYKVPRALGPRAGPLPVPGSAREPSSAGMSSQPSPWWPCHASQASHLPSGCPHRAAPSSPAQPDLARPLAHTAPRDYQATSASGMGWTPTLCPHPSGTALPQGPFAC